MEVSSQVIPILIALAALVVSVLSLRASSQTVRATVFDRRFDIYADAEKFIAAWGRDGYPDIQTELRTLVGAWTRSHFICHPSTTQYLRKLWLDGIEANKLRAVIAGELPGDHAEAVRKYYELLRLHADYDKLREVFMKDLRI